MSSWESLASWGALTTFETRLVNNRFVRDAQIDLLTSSYASLVIVKSLVRGKWMGGLEWVLR